jgi:hypothetical protein
MNKYAPLVFGWYNEQMHPKDIIIVSLDDADITFKSTNQTNYSKSKIIFTINKRRSKNMNDVLIGNHLLFDTLNECKRDLIVEMFTYLHTK